MEQFVLTLQEDIHGQLVVYGAFHVEIFEEIVITTRVDEGGIPATWMDGECKEV